MAIPPPMIRCKQFSCSMKIDNCVGTCPYSRRPGAERRCSDLAKFILENESDVAAVLERVKPTAGFTAAFPVPTAQGVKDSIEAEKAAIAGRVAVAVAASATGLPGYGQLTINDNGEAVAPRIADPRANIVETAQVDIADIPAIDISETGVVEDSEPIAVGDDEDEDEDDFSEDDDETVNDEEDDEGGDDNTDQVVAVEEPVAEVADPLPEQAPSELPAEEMVGEDAVADVAEIIRKARQARRRSFTPVKKEMVLFVETEPGSGLFELKRENETSIGEVVILKNSDRRIVVAVDATEF